MSGLKKYFDQIKPLFEEGGKWHAFQSIYDGFGSFLFVPETTSKSGAHIHDAIDSKRIMSMVVIALMPALLFGMYNIGYQNALAAGKLAETSFMGMFVFGLLAILPKILSATSLVLALSSHGHNGSTRRFRKDTSLAASSFP